MLTHVPHFTLHTARRPGADGTHNMKRESRAIERTHPVLQNGWEALHHTVFLAIHMPQQARQHRGDTPTYGCAAAASNHSDTGVRPHGCGWTSNTTPTNMTSPFPIIPRMLMERRHTERACHTPQAPAPPPDAQHPPHHNTTQHAQSSVSTSFAVANSGWRCL